MSVRSWAEGQPEGVMFTQFNPSAERHKPLKDEAELALIEAKKTPLWF